MGFRRVGALAKYITSDVAPHQVMICRLIESDRHLICVVRGVDLLL